MIWRKIAQKTPSRFLCRIELLLSAQSFPFSPATIQADNAGRFFGPYPVEARQQQVFERIPFSDLYFCVAEAIIKANIDACRKGFRNRGFYKWKTTIKIE
ncbi:MAG: hypothetical protein ACOYJB_06065 [Christensenellaceae bacterium]|jgi:hypothetical protein